MTELVCQNASHYYQQQSPGSSGLHSPGRSDYMTNFNELIPLNEDWKVLIKLENLWEAFFSS